MLKALLIMLNFIAENTCHHIHINSFWTTTINNICELQALLFRYKLIQVQVILTCRSCTACFVTLTSLLLSPNCPWASQSNVLPELSSKIFGMWSLSSAITRSLLTSSPSFSRNLISKSSILCKHSLSMSDFPACYITMAVQQ